MTKLPSGKVFQDFFFGIANSYNRLTWTKLICTEKLPKTELTH